MTLFPEWLDITGQREQFSILSPTEMFWSVLKSVEVQYPVLVIHCLYFSDLLSGSELELGVDKDFSVQFDSNSQGPDSIQFDISLVRGNSVTVMHL